EEARQCPLDPRFGNRQLSRLHRHLCSSNSVEELRTLYRGSTHLDHGGVVSCPQRFGELAMTCTWSRMVHREDLKSVHSDPWGPGLANPLLRLKLSTLLHRRLGS